MAGDDWTVVGSKGRPRKPRRPPGSVSRLSDKGSGSPAAATRGARRSAEAPADGGAGDHGDAARQDATEAGMPLPGWGAANGHGGGVNGRTGRAKRRQAWVERSPAEKVESLKRSVLEAKRDVAASGFFAALMVALTATDSADSDADEPSPAATAAKGYTHRPGNGSHGGSAAGSSQHAPSQTVSAGPGADAQQQRANPEGSQGSGSSGGGSMAVDRASAGSPMATDGPSSPLHDAAVHDQSQQLHNSLMHVNGGSPTSYATAARGHLHDDSGQHGGAATAKEGPATRHGLRRWRWADVRELVVYGLGSFESGPVPRCQLALTLLLAEAAGGRLATPPQLFDPAFTEVDKVLLREMGCALIPRNEHGRRMFGGGPTSSGASAGLANAANDGRAGQHVNKHIVVNGMAAANCGGDGGVQGQGSRHGSALVYLAHCKPELCNALLDANWSPGQLVSFAVIGNSMHTCEETWAMKSMRRVFASRPSRTLALVRRQAITETGIPECGFPVTGAFNDVAFHVVTAPHIAADPDAISDSD